MQKTHLETAFSAKQQQAQKLLKPRRYLYQKPGLPELNPTLLKTEKVTANRSIPTDEVRQT